MPALCIFCTNAANAFFFGCIVATCCKGLPIWELFLEIVSVCCFHFSPLSRACDICDEVEVFNVGRLRYFKHVIPNVHWKPLMNRKKEVLDQTIQQSFSVSFLLFARDLLVLTASG